tara:strand:- start:360 stop:1508 length:1149 start_codon:yes stop_codon:yes gene_type:complete
MKKKVFTAIGLMSGTSMDGVDLSLIKSDGHNQFTSILDKYFEFDKNLQRELIAYTNQLNTANDLEKYSKKLRTLEREFTLFNFKILNEILTNYKYKIDLIGFHGQTVLHNSEKKISKQIGDGKLLSQLTKKIVINNFRMNDLNKDGQGAPLTPIFHQLISYLINKKKKIRSPINIINIGGISNITQVSKFEDLNYLNIKALDIGPGNCLIDEWIRKKSTKNFDDNGEIAGSGKVNDLILNQAIDNFSIKKYGKSFDIKDFDISFVKGLSLEDGCATLTRFTAHLIANGIEYINKSNNIFPKINLVCGGGRKNLSLVKEINFFLPHEDFNLKNIDIYGFNGDFIESQCFGYLAIRSYLNLPISFPSTTGCKEPTIGGVMNKNF